MIVIMNVCQPTQSLDSGPGVHGAADDCARHTRMVTPINNQYLQATPRMRELLGCRPRPRAKAVPSIGVGDRLEGNKYQQEVRHGGRANRQEVVTGVTSRPLRVSSPANSQTGCVGFDPRHAIQTDRIATGGERWRSTHPPPWLLQNAGKVHLSRT